MPNRIQANLSPSAYRWLAAAAAAIGIAASVVTAQFFIVGLQRLEADAPARNALIAAGVLMIVTELAAFFLAALLPTRQLRALRAQLLLCAGLLVAFEGATIYLTQRTLAHSADAQHTSLQTRIAQAQASLHAQRSTIDNLRQNGATQSASKYNWIRQDGAQTLQRAAAMEPQTSALANQLAALQAQQRPTMTAALGHQGMLAYTVARALLVSGMGLVMCGAAGALLRAARMPTPAPAAITPVQQASPAPTPAPLPRASFASGTSASRWRALAAPMASVALAPVAFALPAALAAPVATAAPTVPTPAPTPKPPTAPQAPKAMPTAPTDTRYQQARAGVLDGSIKPSVRALHAAIGGSTVSIRALQQRLLREGVIERNGQGYRLNPRRPWVQVDLI